MPRPPSALGRATAGAGLALPALLVVHLVLGSLAARPPARFPDTFETDLARITELVTTPGRPWRDVDVEYPPLLVAELELIGSDDVQSTGVRLAWSQLLLHLGVAAALGWGWGRRGAVAYLGLSLPFVAYPFVFQRTDLLSVALAALGAAAWRRDRQTGAGVVLALAAFAKAWPAALGPGLLAARRWRGAVAWALVLAVGGAAWLAYGGTDAPRQVLTFRGATGAQIESLAGNAWSLLSDEPWRIEAGAVRVGDLPAWLRAGLPLLGVALASGTWLLVWRRVRAGCDDRALGVGALTATTALLCTSTLLSTQFTAWLLPWAAIVAAELPARDRWGDGPVRLEVRLVALVAGAAVAAGPLMWNHPEVGHGDPLLWLLTARNAALLVVLGTGLARLARLDPPGPESRPVGAVPSGAAG